MSGADLNAARAALDGGQGLHVFVVGLHEGDLPRRPAAVDDLEVCKMIVAITRTPKAVPPPLHEEVGQYREAAVALSWLDSSRAARVRERY